MLHLKFEAALCRCFIVFIYCLISLSSMITCSVVHLIQWVCHDMPHFCYSWVLAFYQGITLWSIKHMKKFNSWFRSIVVTFVVNKNIDRSKFLIIIIVNRLCDISSIVKGNIGVFIGLFPYPFSTFHELIELAACHIIGNRIPWWQIFLHSLLWEMNCESHCLIHFCFYVWFHIIWHIVMLVDTKMNLAYKCACFLLWCT